MPEQKRSLNLASEVSYKFSLKSVKHRGEVKLFNFSNYHGLHKSNSSTDVSISFTVRSFGDVFLTSILCRFFSKFPYYGISEEKRPILAHR